MGLCLDYLDYFYVNCNISVWALLIHPPPLVSYYLSVHLPFSVYLCMYVCMQVYKNTCTHTCVHTIIYVHKYVEVLHNVFENVASRCLHPHKSFCVSLKCHVNNFKKPGECLEFPQTLRTSRPKLLPFSL